MTDLQRIEQIIDKLKFVKRATDDDTNQSSATSNETPDQLAQMKELLRNGTKHYSTLEEYSKLIQSGLSIEAGLRALEAATEFPPSENPTEDLAGSLVGYLADSRFPRDHGVAAISRILELYPSLPEKARMYAMWFLMNVPEREGAQAVMALVRRYFHEGGIPDHAFNGRYEHPLHANVYFPELLDYARLSSMPNAFSIWNICLQYCATGVLKAEQIASHGSVIATEYRTLKLKLLPVQSESNWSENYEYLADRETAGLLLDLMRFFHADEVQQEIASALVEYRDAVLLSWAVIAALWLGLPVSEGVVERIAADDEARKSFYGMLKKHNQTDVFPARYRTKAAFAQSDLVGWLTYPTELGRVPDEIELTHMVAEETEDGIYDWFLFRFRSHSWAIEAKTDPTKWMAGWSGPFRKDDPPGEVLTPGNTFSEFTAWDAKSPEDHLGLNADERLSHKRTVTEVNPIK